MPEIILLALGSAVFPALLACVAILISRPEPRRLLLAFYVISGVVQQHLWGRLTRRVIVEYAAIGAAGLALLAWAL